VNVKIPQQPASDTYMLNSRLDFNQIDLIDGKEITHRIFALSIPCQLTHEHKHPPLSV
jgi:hypothetical protein